jgi:hypothetical protein
MGFQPGTPTSTAMSAPPERFASVPPVVNLKSPLEEPTVTKSLTVATIFTEAVRARQIRLGLNASPSVLRGLVGIEGIAQRVFALFG